MMKSVTSFVEQWKLQAASSAPTANFTMRKLLQYRAKSWRQFQPAVSIESTHLQIAQR